MVLGAGSHSKQQLRLIPLQQHDLPWCFAQNDAISFPGAHGEEIVRSMCFAPEASVIYTAGEDGKVRAWRMPVDNEDEGVRTKNPSLQGGHDAVGRKKRRKQYTSSREGSSRFKPY